MSHKRRTNPALKRDFVRDPSPDVQMWRQSLHPVSQPSGSTAVPNTTARSQLLTGEMDKSRKDTRNTLSASQGTFKEKLGRTLESTVGLEQEYIKSLQQQVYLLELENNHLRGQAIKATELHPAMTAEAEKMLTRLKESQNRIDSLELELYRKDSNEDVLNAKLKQVNSRVSDEQDKFNEEKKLLMDEIISVRKEKDQLERELSRTKMMLNETKDDHSRNLVGLKSAEAKVESLRMQLTSEMDKTKVAEMTLTEKRSHIAQLEAQLRVQEDKYFTTSAEVQEQAKQELRDEIRHLRQKLKEAELAAENDRFLRSKMSDDSSHLVKDNARLTQQVAELTSQIERERDYRDNFDSKRGAESLELSRLKESEKELRYDLNRLRDDLSAEKDRTQHYMNQLAQHQSQSKSQSLDATLARKRLEEAELSQQQVGEELTRLRKDKEYLIEHVDNLQKQLKDKDNEVNSLTSHITSLESRLATLETSANLEGSLQSRRWEELEKMADTIRSHARLMASTSGSSPRMQRKSKVPEYY